MIDADQQVPPNDSEGLGFGVVTLTPFGTGDYFLDWDISWAGLTGPAIRMHFHGPADFGENGPVQEEIGAMIEVCPTDWWRCFLQLLSTSGMRKNEVLHLEWRSIDFAAGTVKVCRQVGGRFVVDGEELPLLPWSAKARSSYSVIPLPPETITELQRFKLKAGQSPYVFVDLPRLRLADQKIKNGTLRDNYELANNLIRSFKMIQLHARELLAKRSGLHIDKIPWRVGCLHDLRDTYLTSVKHLSVDVLKRVAGHSNVSTTLRYYTAETDRDADDVRAALVNSGLARPQSAAG